MFQECVSPAWAALLLHRNKVSWEKEKFGLWPSVANVHIDLWAKLDEWVLDTILKQNMSVWNASSCCVDIEEGLFTSPSGEAEDYIHALSQMQMPVVRLEVDLFQKLEQAAQRGAKSMNLLSPTSARGFLRQSKLPVHPDIASVILEYCLLDALRGKIQGDARTVLYHDLHKISLWPTVQGYLSNSLALLLPRDRKEMELFERARPSETLDVSRITVSVQELLQKDVSIIPFMRHRALVDLLADWSSMYPLESNSQDFRDRVLGLDITLNSVWRWIWARIAKDDTSLSWAENDLWLLPVNHSRIRQYIPTRGPLVLIIEKSEALYALVDKMSTSDQAEAPVLLDTQILPHSALRFLRKQAKIVPHMRLACTDDLESCVDWFAV